MQLIIGLGNPGLKYKKTRHNIGFMVLDALQKEHGFPKFKLNKKLKAETSQGSINSQEVLLAKPQTFMNSSGSSVALLSHYYKPSELIVIHDDFDLPLGEVKITENSGSAGHHGVESIIQNLKTNSFKRIRVGIRPTSIPGILKAEDFVLKKLSKEEQEEAIKKACADLQTITAQANY